MMNHLEQLVSEWLQYRHYFVKTSIQVGPLGHGGFEGELDVVALNLSSRHLIHIECSLDSHSWEKREERFSLKFARGRKHIKEVFSGLELPEPDQVALLQYATSATTSLGGARLVTVKGFVAEVLKGLEGTSPSSGAVPTKFPLLRTMQLAAYAADTKAAPGTSLLGYT